MDEDQKIENEKEPSGTADDQMIDDEKVPSYMEDDQTSAKKKKKKWILPIVALAFVLVCALVVVIVSCSNRGPKASEGLEYRLSDDETYYSVVGIGTCKDTKIVIPATYKKLPVMAIGTNAFNDCNSITSVTIPESVTTIEFQAFYSCTGLTEINFNATDVGEVDPSAFGHAGEWEDGITVHVGANVTKIPAYLFSVGTVKIASVEFEKKSVCERIGNGAFSNCSDLTSIVLADSVTSIGDNAFSNCSSLTGITLGENVTTIGDSAFSYCSGLTSITLGENITSIGEWAFYGCEGLTELNYDAAIGDASSDSAIFANAGKSGDGIALTIGANVTHIPAYLFCYSSVNIVNVTFEEGNACTEIGSYVFSNCSSLTSIALPDSVTSIAESAFYNCSSLASIEIPDGVTIIKDSTFYNCSSLASVVVPDSVTSIGGSAFYHCSSLTGLELSENVTSIGKSAFYNCSSLASFEIPEGVTSIESYTFYHCGSLMSVTIPDSITSIGTHAFDTCSSLLSLTIPENVATIETYAFYDCQALTEIRYNAISAGNFASDNYVFYKAGRSGSGITVTFGEKVTAIPSRLFCPSGSSYLPNIVTVTIGNSVKSIGSYAFYKSSGLTSITISDSVTSIGTYAFYDCSGLKTLTIGSGVKSIGDYAFSRCQALAEVRYNATEMDDLSSGNFTFEWAGTTGEGIVVTIGSNVTKIPAYLFCSTSSLVSGSSYYVNVVNLIFEAESSCLSIGKYAFAYCKNLTSITIPTSVTKIGRFAFYCDNLTSATFEDPTTWYATTVTSYTGGSVVDFSDPSKAADELSSYLNRACYWYKA